jgi:cytochrome P450
VSVGRNYSGLKINYERQDGKFDLIGLSEFIIRLLTDTIIRSYKTHHLLLPIFVKYSYLPSDLLYDRNVRRFRQELQRMINERRSGVSPCKRKDGDLLTILMSSEFYVNQDNMMIDEIFTFFLAGMKTIQVSTTNLIYYITKHPEIK